MEFSLTLLRLGWWKLVSLLLLILMELDTNIYETRLLDEYVPGISGALFVSL